MIFEKIYDMDNLQASWERVRVNKAAPGIDRVRCEDFEKNLAFNLQKIAGVRQASTPPNNVQRVRGLLQAGLFSLRTKQYRPNNGDSGLYIYPIISCRGDGDRYWKGAAKVRFPAENPKHCQTAPFP